MSIIPYVGFTLGFLTALMVSFANFTGWGTIFAIASAFLVIQALEGFLITPKLVGNKVGLSAFATMLSLIIGGNLFGLVGVLLAIPAAATLKFIVSDLKNEIQKKELYSG